MFLAFLQFLVPGYAWILIFGLSHRLNLLEKLCLSFLLSVCLSSLLTAALSLVTAEYMFYSTAISLGLSFAIVGIFLARREGSMLSTLRLRIDRDSWPVLAIIGIYAIILLSLYWSTPFYPTADAYDPILHIEFTKTIIEGNARTVLFHTPFSYPSGLHFASAILASLLHVDAFQSLRILLSLVLLDALALTYFSTCALLGNRNVAWITVFVAAFLVPVDAIHFIRIGTFSNIMGDAVTLALLWLIFYYVRHPSCAVGVTLAFLGSVGIFMHYGFPLFLGALWISIPFLFTISRKTTRDYFKAVMYSTAGSLLLCIFTWRILTGYLYAMIIYYLEPAPIFLSLQQLIINLSSFVGPANAIAIGIALLFVLKKQRKAIGPGFAAIWTIFLIVISFFSYINWRFVLFSLVPGTFLIGNMIGSVTGFHVDPVLKNYTSRKMCSRIIVPLVLLALAVSGGFVSLLPRIYDPSERVQQTDVIDSMRWLKQKGVDSPVASVGLTTDYRYLPVITGICYAGDFDEPAQTILRLSLEKGFSCVVVSVKNLRICSFEQNSFFHEEYRNGSVAIFFIGK